MEQIKKDISPEEQSATTLSSPPDKQTTDSVLPKELEKVVEELPTPIKQSVELSMMSMISGRNNNPIIQKLTPEHISKFLDYTQEDDRRDHSLKASNRWFHLAYVVIAIIVFIFLVVYLLDRNTPLLIDILKLFIAFIGGMGSGFGIKSAIDRDKN